MSADSKFQIPSGYERGIRFGANWTMIISPYMTRASSPLARDFCSWCYSRHSGCSC
jgi:hypothetical protein